MKLKKNPNFKYERIYEKISGYCTTYNCINGKFPFIQSITSALAFCDEVVVVDGESDDGTFEELEEAFENNDKVQIYQNAFDWEEPGMDGQQKAFGRALCEHPFLIQFDVDEVFHENDVEKWRMLTKRFPTNANILHLPVIEAWGNPSWATARRAPWKWRLSKNLPEITHGIQKEARLTNEETGKVYAKKGCSDGCFYVNCMDYSMLPHVGFYTTELEMIRIHDPLQFAKIMNHLYETLPSVWHYSWCGLENKINQLKPGGVWDKMWSLLYQEEAQNRWPDVDFSDENAIKDLAEHLFEQGGEDEDAVKYKFKLAKKQPKIMEGFFDEIEDGEGG